MGGGGLRAGRASEVGVRVGAEPGPEGAGAAGPRRSGLQGPRAPGSLALRAARSCPAAPRPAGRPPRPSAQMAVRGASTLTPFSIQAILNKKEERGGLPAPEGRPVPGGTAVAAAAAEAPAVCCWRLFGETDAGALGGAEDSLLASPGGTRTAAGRTSESLAGWDSDSALSEENEGGRRCADAPGASGAGRAGGTLGLGQPGCELPAAKDLEEEAAGRSDSEMSASVSGLPGRRGEGGRAQGRAGRPNVPSGVGLPGAPCAPGPEARALAPAALLLPPGAEPERDPRHSSEPCVPGEA